MKKLSTWIILILVIWSGLLTWRCLELSARQNHLFATTAYVMNGAADFFIMQKDRNQMHDEVIKMILERLDMWSDRLASEDYIDPPDGYELFHNPDERGRITTKWPIVEPIVDAVQFREGYFPYNWRYARYYIDGALWAAYQCAVSREEYLRTEAKK